MGQLRNYVIMNEAEKIWSLLKVRFTETHIKDRKNGTPKLSSHELLAHKNTKQLFSVFQLIHEMRYT